MKCAVDVMSQLDRPRGCAVDVPVNHDDSGVVPGNRYAARCACSTYAFATRDPHGDTGCGSTVDVDSFHAAPGFSRVPALAADHDPTGAVADRVLELVRRFELPGGDERAPETRREALDEEDGAQRAERPRRLREERRPGLGAQGAGSGNATERNAPAPGC